MIGQTFTTQTMARAWIGAVTAIFVFFNFAFHNLSFERQNYERVG